VGSGEYTRVKLFKKSTVLDADRCFDTGNFEGNLYAPKYDDGTGPAELNEGYVCDYEDLDATGKLNVKLLNNGVSAKTFTYSITLQLTEKSVSLTYTPTLTNTTNISASTPFASMFVRTGNLVVVYWTVDVTPTAAAPTATELQISLPIASNFSDTIQAAGCGNCLSVPAQTSIVESNAANDRAAIKFLATNTGNANHRGTFMYRVI
jgi:hypothetical protein